MTKSNGDLSKAFRQLLVELMSEAGVTSHGLAQKAGMAHTTIYRILNEERVPNLDTVERLLAALGFDAIIELTPR
jgi:DNA-binding phage protein